MKTRNIAILFFIWFSSCIAALYIGTIYGFIKGTQISTVLSASSTAANKANVYALALAMSKEPPSSEAFSMLENMMESSLAEYYRFRDVDPKAFDLGFLQKFNSFLDAEPSTGFITEYLREHKTEKEIQRSEVFSRLITESVRGN